MSCSGWRKLAQDVKDPRVLVQLAETKAKFEAAKEAASTPMTNLVQGMPDTALDGRLGEICKKRMKSFPLAYSHLALATAASAKARRAANLTKYNIYTAIVEPTNSGKTFPDEVHR
jgi:hypothetical protein